MQYSALSASPTPFAARGHITHVSNNEEMAFKLHGSTSRFLLFSFKKDPRKILMAKDHARERKKPFYAKTKVSAFANFVVGRLIKKKKMEKSAV